MRACAHFFLLEAEVGENCGGRGMHSFFMLVSETILQCWEVRLRGGESESRAVQSWCCGEGAARIMSEPLDVVQGALWGAFSVQVVSLDCNQAQGVWTALYPLF